MRAVIFSGVIFIFSLKVKYAAIVITHKIPKENTKLNPTIELISSLNNINAIIQSTLLQCFESRQVALLSPY